MVTLEVSLVSRYWTWPFFIVTFFSYVLVFPFQARPAPHAAPARHAYPVAWHLGF